MTQPTSSMERPLALRLRPDLIAAPVEMAGTPTWVIKDPLTLEHFQFSAEEYALLQWLREPVSIAELRRRFAREFPPQTISPQALWEFLSRLHSAGLLLAEAAGQGAELLDRMHKERARRWALSWTGILAMRFRGFDPDRFLTATRAYWQWLFSPLVLAAALVLVIYAGTIVIGHFDDFLQRLPEMSALVDPRNVVWLLVAIGVVKMLHELGHALACKHFGGEVHEMGLMLLIFVPCLYCDVSDAWQLKSKWQRLAVSAAGMAVELVLAAMATIVWWHAEPGIVQLIALDIMIVCTVGTLLVNGNPLLRYDGYYILSDLVETPNLWQRSRTALRQFSSEWLLGEAAGDDPLLPARQRGWLAAYAIASKLYVVLICVAIFWGLVHVLYPLQLQSLAYAVGFVMLGSALVGPTSGALRLARDPIRRAELRKGRLAVAGSVALAAAVAVLAVPVNYHVHAPFVLMPADGERVYATIEGTLVDALQPGQSVARGAVIGTLKSVETQRELAKAEAEHDARRLRVEHLRRLRGFDLEANNQLPAAEAALAGSRRRLEELRREAERLSLTSLRDGVLISAPRVATASNGTERLPTWSGSLLDPTNRGAHVEPGTLVCLVGDPARLTAQLLVDDTDVKRLRPGQRVRLRIEQLPGRIMRGEIVDVARHDVRGEASAGAGRADLASLFAGLAPPGRATTFYRASVRFDAPRQPLVIGGRGDAKVATERITLARRIFRYFRHTFRLPV